MEACPSNLGIDSGAMVIRTRPIQVILALGIDTVSEEVDGVGAVAGGGEGGEIATVVICGSGSAGDTRGARARLPSPRCPSRQCTRLH